MHPQAANTVSFEAAPTPRIVLTVEQAAELLGIGRTLMYELISSGAVESVLIGRLRRVPADAVADYVERLCTAQRQEGAA